MVLAKIEGLFSVTPTDDVSIPGYHIGLEPVICWQIRELHLHGNHSKSIELNLKLDGRPFGGKLYSNNIVNVVNLHIIWRG